MEKLKHTPGPWIHSSYGFQILSNNRIKPQISICQLDGKQPEQIQVANAKLIATAPELLEALIFHESKPLHPNNPESKFKDLKTYNKAYKIWAKEFEELKKAAIKKATE